MTVNFVALSERIYLYLKRIEECSVLTFLDLFVVKKYRDHKLLSGQRKQ